MLSKWNPSLTTYSNVVDLETGARELETALMSAQLEACPLREIRMGRGQPWWNKELERTRKKVRRALRIALKKNDDASWGTYRNKRNDFRKMCRKEDRNGWHSYCDGISDYPESSRLMRVLAKDRTCKLGSIIIDNKLVSDPKLVLCKMMGTHFPECQEGTDDEDTMVSNAYFDWLTAENIVTKEKLEWSIHSFAPYKAAGPDGIFPKMLQIGYKYIEDIVLKLFRASLASGYLPLSWRKVKAVFIPKPAKKTYQEAKSFRCISLSSFILKAMEKIIDGYMRSKLETSVLPLHNNQHAYMAGKSTETALHNLVVRIERALSNKEFALGCFFDVEGAFDKANREAIESALHRDGIDSAVEIWTMNMLQHRSISAELGGEVYTIKSTRGFPQGGCLSPLLWCLLLDSLVVKINNMKIYMQAYSDDGVLLVTGKDLHTVRSIMSTGIKTTMEWCRGKGLNLNPLKTKLVLFTKRRKNTHLTPIIVEGVELELIKEIKYLGIILDNTLRFGIHIKEQCSKAKIALLQCRRAVGRTWGMKPYIIRWIYVAIILPRILYGAIVWWHKAATKTNSKELTRVQRMATLMISGAIRTTPSASLEVLLGLFPLDLEAKKRAIEQWYRMKLSKQWKGNFMDIGHTEIEKIYGDKLSMIITNNDLIKRQRVFDKKYRVHIGSIEKWEVETADEDMIICYTDGSRRESTKLSGAGILYGTIPEKGQSISLGKYASVFQAETYAILECAVSLMDSEEIETKEVIIYSDSQAALKALKKKVTNSALVKECKYALNSLAEKTKVTIAWVPGHKGNDGNEKADELAREGAGTEFHGPEPCLPIPYTITKKIFEGIVERESNKRWNNSTQYRQSKLFLKSFDRKKTKQLMSQSRTNIALVAGITTGHCLLNRHLTVMRIEEDPSCPECGDEETSYHFIAECPMYSLVRWELQGKDSFREEDLAYLSVGDIVRFTKATGRFEGGRLPGHQ